MLGNSSFEFCKPVEGGQSDIDSFYLRQLVGARGYKHFTGLVFLVFSSPLIPMFFKLFKMQNKQDNLF